LPTTTPSPTEALTPSPGVTPVATADERTARVGIVRAESYDTALVRQRVRDVLDAAGGLAQAIRPGDRVAIKVNLTGGVGAGPLQGVPAVESYVTHPDVVRALGECVRDAGAAEILIVEAVYDWDSYREWGYEDVAAAIDATLIDLNDARPYDDFASMPVGGGAFIYDRFTFHHVLEEADVFVSVSKMKCHYSCGVTHSLKNLIGLVPTRFYRLDQHHNYRSALHGTAVEMGTRLPRVIVDLNRARPIHYALIDGIKTAEGGEGTWIGSISPVQPGVLFAGADPVAVDAVATAAMDFDPTATRSTSPFLRSDNHLNLAHEMGLGTNCLDEIKVAGAAIEDVRLKFAPSMG
jgi:uncharacterized protein (DUF362 family)